MPAVAEAEVPPAGEDRLIVSGNMDHTRGTAVQHHRVVEEPRVARLDRSEAVHQGNSIFRERHTYCGESSKDKRAVVAVNAG